MINLSFLAEITIQWSLFLGLYFLLFRHRTFFGLNRFYLLASLVLGIALPLLHTFAPNITSTGIVFNLPEILITPNKLKLQTTATAPITNWLSILYYSGVIIFFGIFMLNMIKLIYAIQHLRKHKQGHHWIVALPQKTAPFSFFNFVFIFRKEAYAKEEWNQILLHEQTHGRLLHSLDILFIEILKIVFWWNPLVYLYKVALRDVHEFQADSVTTKRHNKKEYSRLLFRHTQSGMQVPLTSNFISSQLKKRIKMLTIKRSNPDTKLRYLLAFPLLALLFFVSCQSDVSEVAKAVSEAEKKEIKQNEALEETPSVDDSPIFKAIEEMPKYEGCSESPGNGKLDKCSEKAFLMDIYNTIHYPQEARNAGIQGRVILQFIINTSGKMEKIKVLKSPAESLSIETLRTLNKINNSKTWTPGRHEGENVRVQYILPVSFKLE